MIQELIIQSAKNAGERAKRPYSGVAGRSWLCRGILPIINHDWRHVRTFVATAPGIRNGTRRFRCEEQACERCGKRRVGQYMSWTRMIFLDEAGVIEVPGDPGDAVPYKWPGLLARAHRSPE